MAFLSHSHSNAGVGLRERVTGWVAALSERAVRYHTYRRTLTELEQLSDRELADLGLSRAEIQAVARGAVYP